MSTVACLDCQRPIQTKTLLSEGRFITCPHCGAELEIISTEPFELDWAYLEPAQSERGWRWWAETSG